MFAMHTPRSISCKTKAHTSQFHDCCTTGKVSLWLLLALTSCTVCVALFAVVYALAMSLHAHNIHAKHARRAELLRLPATVYFVTASVLVSCSCFGKITVHKQKPLHEISDHEISDHERPEWRRSARTASGERRCSRARKYRCCRTPSLLCTCALPDPGLWASRPAGCSSSGRLEQQSSACRNDPRTCPSLSPSPPAHSFIIGPAVINTHPRTSIEKHLSWSPDIPPADRFPLHQLCGELGGRGTTSSRTTREVNELSPAKSAYAGDEVLRTSTRGTVHM